MQRVRRVRVSPSDGQVFFPCKTCIQTLQALEKRKQQHRNTNLNIRNSNQTWTYLCWSSCFFQGLENITYSFYKCCCFSLRTLMSTLFTDCLQPFVHKKDDIFTKQKRKDSSFVMEEVCDGYFPWTFEKSLNRYESNEHELSRGPSSGDVCQTQYISGLSELN